LASEYRLNIEISDADLVSLCDQHLVSKRDQASLLASRIKRPSKESPKKEDKRGALAPVFPHRKNKTVPPSPAQLRAFKSWYSVYPKHVGEKPAREAWLKLDPDPELVATITAATARYVDLKADVEPRFVLDPANWLNDEHWTDELPGSAGKGNPAPEVKDLGDGWVMAGGQKMKRETYERRARDDARP
jgi:hypothetical protein